MFNIADKEKVSNKITLEIPYANQDIQTIKTETELGNKSKDKGFVNRSSSMVMKDNGQINLCSSPYAQIKINPNGQVLATSMENRIKTNRFIVETDEFMINNHKLNPKLAELSDHRVCYGYEPSSIGNLKLSGTVLIKAWDYQLKKYVLVRRPTHLAAFGQEVNLAVIPQFLKMTDRISTYDLTSKAVSASATDKKEDVKTQNESKTDQITELDEAKANVGTIVNSISNNNQAKNNNSVVVNTEPVKVQASKDNTKKADSTTVTENKVKTEAQKSLESAEKKSNYLKTYRGELEEVKKKNEASIMKKEKEFMKLTEKDDKKKKAIQEEIDHLKGENKEINQMIDTTNKSIKKADAAVKISSYKVTAENKIDAVLSKTEDKFLKDVHENWEKEAATMIDKKIKEVQKKYEKSADEIVDTKVNATISAMNRALIDKEKIMLKGIEKAQVDLDYKLTSSANKVNDRIDKIFGSTLGSKMHIDTSKYVTSAMASLKTGLAPELAKYTALKTKYFDKVTNIKKSISEFKKKQKERAVNWVKNQWKNSALKAKLSAKLNPIKDKLKASLSKAASSALSWLKKSLKFR